jgi:hypothetical protein
VKRIALLCPNSWDDVQLARALPRVADRYEVVPYGTDAEDNPAAFDALAFLEQAVAHFRRDPVDGVTSSSDYPGVLVAAALAKELGLAGPGPEAVFRCSHKYYSRLAQREAVPEATPPFALVTPKAEGLDFPCFVKPVKSWFSVLARRVESPEALRRLLNDPEAQAHLTEFVTPFNQLLRRYTSFDVDGGHMLAEGLLSGAQVTVEGFVCDGKVTIVGVVDSVMFPGTISFQRFDYPSTLPAAVQARMGDICRLAISHIGLNRALFNVELFYNPDVPPEDQLNIIEINPRMCGQFADLYESVDGTNTYEVLLALAAGDMPRWEPGAGRHAVAASFPLRVFDDRLVVRVPDASGVAAVKRQWPVTLAKAYCRPGQRLSETNQGDGTTWRYGMVNMAGTSHSAMLADFERVLTRLDFQFGP